MCEMNVAELPCCLIVKVMNSSLIIEQLGLSSSEYTLILPSYYSHDAHSLDTQLLAHSMVVFEHVFICRQIKLSVVLRVLSKRNGGVLVHDAAHFYMHPRGDLATIVVSDYLYFFAYTEETELE